MRVCQTVRPSKVLAQGDPVFLAHCYGKQLQHSSDDTEHGGTSDSTVHIAAGTVGGVKCADAWITAGPSAGRARRIDRE
jgi:hypothetical protein